MKLLLLCIPYDGGKSGISVYIDNVVRELSTAGHELTLIVEKEAVPFFEGYRLKVLPTWICRPVLNMIFTLAVLPFQLKKGSYDRLIVCAANRRMVAFSRMETVAVVHDLSQYHVKAKYDCMRMMYIKHVLPYFVRRVPFAVAAISQSTADDCVRFWHIPAGKVYVNYNGVRGDGLPLGMNDGTGRDVLYVSRIEHPGKNHANLIRAWELLPEGLTRKFRLVIAGSDWFGAEEVHRMAEVSPKRESIFFSGFANREKLREMYRMCRVYVFPSFFEGFGLSLVEAMACGAVCACSNNSSLGEVAADAALTFDPERPEDIAEALKVALTDDTKRAELREKGFRRMKAFDWGRHAARLAEPPSGFAEVFGVRFGRGTMAEAVADIGKFVRERPVPCAFGAFVNADCLNKAYRDETYRQVLASADRVWADGSGVALAAKFKGTAVLENVNGTDMLKFLCEKGFSLYLLGGAPGVAELAAERLKKLEPACRIAGTHHGYFKKADLPAVLENIRAAAPDIVLVALGAPKQEEWIAAHRGELNCAMAIGVGGLLDFASGRIPRAPSCLRKMGLEWTFRLWQEPRRLFRRYVLGNPLFLFRLLREGR